MKAFQGRPRVLIVDDSPENVQLLMEMLHGDYLPVTASSGLQALQLANDDPAPDVILLDIMMPGMNGYEVCTRLKSEPKTRDIPIIFVTALTDKNEEHKGLELGGAATASGFELKTFLEGEGGRAVKRYCTPCRMRKTISPLRGLSLL